MPVRNLGDRDVAVAPKSSRRLLAHTKRAIRDIAANKHHHH